MCLQLNDRPLSLWVCICVHSTKWIDNFKWCSSFLSRFLLKKNKSEELKRAFFWAHQTEKSTHWHWILTTKRLFITFKIHCTIIAFSEIYRVMVHPNWNGETPPASTKMLLTLCICRTYQRMRCKRMSTINYFGSVLLLWEFVQFVESTKRFHQIFQLDVCTHTHTIKKHVFVIIRPIGIKHSAYSL